MYQLSSKFSFLFIPAFAVIKLPKIKCTTCYQQNYLDTKYLLLNLFEINELHNQRELVVFSNSNEFIIFPQIRWKNITLDKEENSTALPNVK